MGFKEAIDSVLKQNYANFQGRAARSEFWFFTLFVVIVEAAFILLFLTSFDFATWQISGFGYLVGALLAIFGLAILIPSIAVVVRRLHDRNMSGWWYLGLFVLGVVSNIAATAGAIGVLLSIIYLVASIAMLVIFCLKGTDGDNRFGPDPLRPSARADIFA